MANKRGPCFLLVTPQRWPSLTFHIAGHISVTWFRLEDDFSYSESRQKLWVAAKWTQRTWLETGGSPSRPSIPRPLVKNLEEAGEAGEASIWLTSAAYHSSGVSDRRGASGRGIVQQESRIRINPPPATFPCRTEGPTIDYHCIYKNISIKSELRLRRLRAVPLFWCPGVMPPLPEVFRRIFRVGQKVAQLLILWKTFTSVVEFFF